MLSKVLYMAVVGQREADAKAVAVRHRTEGDLGAMGVDAFRIAIREEIDTKGNRCVADTRKV
jgi:threonyl-tRNA synthetase